SAFVQVMRNAELRSHGDYDDAAHDGKNEEPPKEIYMFLQAKTGTQIHGEKCRQQEYECTPRAEEWIVGPAGRKHCETAKCQRPKRRFDALTYGMPMRKNQNR